MSDDEPFTCTVTIEVWRSGDLKIKVIDAGESDEDSRAIAFALRVAADEVEGVAQQHVH